MLSLHVLQQQDVQADNHGAEQREAMDEGLVSDHDQPNLLLASCLSACLLTVNTATGILPFSLSFDNNPATGMLPFSPSFDNNTAIGVCLSA